MKKLQGAFCLLSVLFATRHTAVAKDLSPSWQTRFQSVAALARAGTALTDPIFENLPEWSQDQGLDPTSFISNPAILAINQNPNWSLFPLSLRVSEKGGYFSASPFKHEPKPAAEVAENVGAGTYQTRQWALSSTLIKNEVGFHMGWDRVQMATHTKEKNLIYQDSVDSGIRFAIGSQLLKVGDTFNSHLGIGVKAILREAAFIKGTSSVNLSNEPVKKFKALGMGADIGLLTSFKSDALAAMDSSLNLALAWRDFGNTHFLNSLSEKSDQRSPPYPGHLIFGAGLLLPKFRDSHRSALRVEYQEWGRDVKAFERIALGFEHRFPKMLSLNMGFKNPGLRGGLSFRFKGVEMDLASIVEDIRYNNQKKSSRLYVMELRSVFN